MIIKFCLYCDKEFRTFESRIKKGIGRFCSVSCANMKREPWNKGKIGVQSYSADTRTKMSHSHQGISNYWYGKKFSDEHRRALSLSHLGYKHSEEQLRKILGRRDISTLEAKMQEIIKNNNLPYQFVGNGKLFIGRKNPDFVNVNGENKAIEVYYRKHKQMFRGNVDNWKKERTNIFNQYGWSLLFFDETQVNTTYVLEKLRGGY